MSGMSLIMATYHKDRVERANNLIRMLRLDSGIDLQIIVVTDNPETHESYPDADLTIRLPKRLGFTRCANIGEKFATYTNLWWIDDYVTVKPEWGKKAMQAFWEKFPDGMGIMELSLFETDCPKSISTRSYVYSLNNMNMLWPEYLHCGDTEMWYRATAQKRFYMYPEELWTREKIVDHTKKVSKKQEGWDSIIREERRSNSWTAFYDPTVPTRMVRWAKETGDKDNIELVDNLFNL